MKRNTHGVEIPFFGDFFVARTDYGISYIRLKLGVCQNLSARGRPGAQGPLM